MKIDDALYAVAGSGFAREQLPVDCRLGLPHLRVSGAGLLLELFPHRTLYRNGGPNVYSPCCALTLRYPFRRVERFLRLEERGPFPQTVTEAAAGDAARDLYRSCDGILAGWEKGDRPGEDVLARHEALFRAAVRQLGLTAVYAPGAREDGL